MRAHLKRAFLIASKYAGLFWLAGLLTRRGLRILCFHGSSLDDEHLFRPKLFMRAATLARRLAFLKRAGFPVLPLGEAVERLRAGTLPARAVAVTIDDGFYGTYRDAAPLFRRLAMPATLYITSYYVVRRNPVYGLVVQYMFWKTQREEADLGGLVPEIRGTVSLRDAAVRTRVMDQIVDYGEARCDEAARCALARALGERLGVDYDEIVKRRMLGLMSVEELRGVAAAGLDVQSHTHRHRFPMEEAVARQELVDNRAALEPAIEKRLEHFCYPSGEWSARQWPWLEAAGMKTATTCDEGINYAATPPLALRRFVDGEDISPIEFEAKLSGYADMLRAGRQGIRRLLGGEF